MQVTVFTQDLIFVITSITSECFPVEVKTSCLCSQMIVGAAVIVPGIHLVLLLFVLSVCFIRGSCRAGPASRLNITNTFLIMTLCNPDYERVACTLSSLLFARYDETSLEVCYPTRTRGNTFGFRVNV